MKHWMKYMLATGAGLTLAGSVNAVEVNEKLNLTGDIRLRHETIEEDDADTRNRWRIRVRAGVDAVVNETVKAEIGLATGDGDPVSRNVTLDEGFSTKDFMLDKAILTWTPANIDTALMGGKMPVPFAKTQDLVWDGDLTIEGAAAKKSLKGDAGGIDLVAGAFSAEERSSDEETMLYGASILGNTRIFGSTGFEIGAGIFQWDNMEGQAVLVDPVDSFGNDAVEVIDPETMEVTELLYANEFTEVNAMAKLKFDTAIPFAVYADYVINTEADSDDTGMMYGLTLGKAKDPGSFELDYNFRDLEANAVVGAYTDSDGAGGGTGYDGHKFSAKYQIAENFQAGASLFLNELGDGSDYTRGQLDLIGKF